MTRSVLYKEKRNIVGSEKMT